jgi:GntR family transcriptional repressor for pyruvate dehydrogenase complex
VLVTDVESRPEFASRSWRTDEVTATEEVRGRTRLTRRTLAEMLRDELCDQILSGRLAAGDVLPTESDLCTAFGVGRTTVREALQGLQAHGFVQRRGGRLAVIDRAVPPSEEADLAALASRLSVREIFETRKLIEVEIARLAAEHHTERELAELRALVREPGPADAEQYHLLDERFHLLLAGMCKNQVLTQVFRSNVHLFFKLPAYWRAGASATARVPFPGAGRAGHATIVDAIASGNGEIAASAMYEHLDRVERRLLDRMAVADVGETPERGAPPSSVRA